MIVVLDNYDSFVHNLARYLVRLGKRTEVIRNDAVSVDELRSLAPSAIVISPGPCTPAEAGVTLDVIRELHRDVPILGVCLGHQAIGVAFGAHLYRSQPVHGRDSVICHDQRGEFRRMPDRFSAARYHSLAISRSTVPDCLEVSAWTEDGTVMGMRHRLYPIYGWQFHPESVLTPMGLEMLQLLFEEFDKRQSALNEIRHNVIAGTNAKRAS